MTRSTQYRKWMYKARQRRCPHDPKHIYAEMHGKYRPDGWDNVHKVSTCLDCFRQWTD